MMLMRLQLARVGGLVWFAHPHFEIEHLHKQQLSAAATSVIFAVSLRGPENEHGDYKISFGPRF